MSYHVCVGPDFGTAMFRALEAAEQFCEMNPGWSYLGEMEELLHV